MPIVVVGNANQPWEQMPSPPKTRLPIHDFTLVKPRNKFRMMQNRIKDKEK